ncbi:MAG: flavin reductase family protein [Gemmatimonadetes bacterium]|nr:flavin reductase family protein [Gemmatimonadota bacterium]
MIDTSEFRRVLGHFTTGVSIVTTVRADGRPCGLTVNAFSSVSLQPTLVLVCVEKVSDSHGCIHASGIYAVNVLEEGKGESLSRRFATWAVEDKFEGVAYRDAKTGAPVLEAALAWVDCRVVEGVSVGDHTVFIGEVLDADAREGRPLVYYRGGYGRFEP